MLICLLVHACRCISSILVLLFARLELSARVLFARADPKTRGVYFEPTHAIRHDNSSCYTFSRVEVVCAILSSRLRDAIKWFCGLLVTWDSGRSRDVFGAVKCAHKWAKRRTYNAEGKRWFTNGVFKND